MNLMTAVKTCIGKYATFSGRAQRSEFWWFVLFAWLGTIILSMVDSTLFGTVVTTSNGFSASTNTPIFSGIFSLAILIPSIAVGIRRMHDTDRSGWWMFIVLVPILGFILYIVWQASKGTHGQNRFGNDPLGGSNDGGDFAQSSIPSVDN